MARLSAGVFCARNFGFKAAKQSVPVPAAPADEMKNETAAALLEPNSSDRALRIAAILQKLSRSNWKGIREAFADEKRLHGRSHVPEWDLMTRRAGEIMGREAVEFLLAEDIRAKNYMGATKQALTGWAAKDPAGALEWLSREASDDTRRQIMGAAIRGLIISEPDLAISAFEAISPDRRKLYTNEFAAGLVRSVGLDNAETLINGMIARSSSSGNVGSAGYDIIFKDFALIKIQTAYAKGNIEEAIHWLTPQLGKSHVDQSLVVAAVERYARVEPEKAAAWLEGVNDARSATQQGTIGYRALLSTWTQKAGQPAVGEWLKTQTGRPHYDRLALEFSSLLAAQNPAEAARWAGTIKDSTVRANAMARLQPQTK